MTINMRPVAISTDKTVIAKDARVFFISFKSSNDNDTYMFIN